MTISADGVDLLRSVEGQAYGALTGAWAAQDSQTDAGRFSVMIIGDIRRTFHKLFVPNPYTKTISGIVTEGGSPVARAVALFRRSDSELVRRTVSDAGTGVFSFTNLVTAEPYFVVAFDDTGTAPSFNAQIYDLVEGV